MGRVIHRLWAANPTQNRGHFVEVDFHFLFGQIKGPVVYLFREMESDYHKVGITSAGVSQRCSSVQTGNPRTLAIVGVVSCVSRREAAMKEAMMLRRVKAKGWAVGGEWFKADPEDALGIFYALCAPRPRRTQIPRAIVLPFPGHRIMRQIEWAILGPG